LLSKGGALYFSTNFLGFELDSRVTGGERVKSLPEDFRREVQQTWRFVA
jgi:23S rRNA (cytosine1962-C5)-methyltransferase